METKDPHAPREVETSVDRFEHDIEELEGLGKKHWGWWILGGLAVAASLIVLWLSSQQKRPVPVMAVAGVAQLDLLEPRGGRLASPPVRFAWESVSGRHNYVFRLGRKGSPNPLVERTVKENSLELTAEEAGRLTKGGSYVWQVEARTKQGAGLAAGRGVFDL